MTIRIIRIIAILFAVFASAIVLPRIYRSTFTPASNRHITIAYSEVLNDFILSDYRYDKHSRGLNGETHYSDRKGNIYDKEDLSRLLLLDNVSQLAFEGRFPDTICGVAVTPSLVADESFTMYYSADPGLYYGLLELRDQMSYTSRELEARDLFRIGEKGIEFIVCASNRVDSVKSRLFNDLLTAQGFVPPARRMWTPVDKTASEMLGYYVTDNKNDLYRICMHLSQPLVSKLSRPEGKTIRNISFGRTPDFTAILITEEGDTYLQFADGHYLKMPLPDARNNSVTLSGNLFFRIFRYSNANEESAYVFDREYQPIDHFTLAVDRTPPLSARISEFLFPFSIRQTVWNGFRIIWSPWHSFIWLNLLLTGIHFFYFRKRKRNPAAVFNLIDLLLILAFGLFGWIGIFAFPAVRYTSWHSNHTST